MGNKGSKAPPEAGEDASEASDQVSSLPVMDDVPAAARRRNRRCSVSAEVDKDEGSGAFEARVVPKSEEAVERIRGAMKGSFLFAAIDRDGTQTILDAMEEKRVEAGETIIHQGAPGDYFYVIDSGEYEVWKKTPGADEPAKVFAYSQQGSFGELALMYNAPRAATVRAATDGVLWAVDRATFRHIVVSAGEKQRKKYEAFIGRVPLFSRLTQKERARIADCLVPEQFDDGETVLRLGDPGDKFYIIETGKAVATQFASEREVVVGRMEEGMFFGERSLITEEPRAANVKADGYLKVAAMDRAAFERLLGDCRDIMGRQIDGYQSAEQVVASGAGAAADEKEGGEAEEAKVEEEQAEEQPAEAEEPVQQPEQEEQQPTEEDDEQEQQQQHADEQQPEEPAPAEV